MSKEEKRKILKSKLAGFVSPWNSWIKDKKMDRELRAKRKYQSPDAYSRMKDYMPAYKLKKPKGKHHREELRKEEEFRNITTYV